MDADESARFKRLAERAQLEDDSVLSSYNASLSTVMQALHAAEAAQARARGLAAGGAARASMDARAAAAARARALERQHEPGQSAPPWAWLPQPPPELPALAMGSALQGALQRSAHYSASNCDTMLGEVGACPWIVRAQQREAAEGLGLGRWEAAQAAVAEREDAEAHAGAAAARDAALQALAAVEGQERRAGRVRLAQFREKEVRPCSCEARPPLAPPCLAHRAHARTPPPPAAPGQAQVP